MEGREGGRPRHLNHSKLHSVRLVWKFVRGYVGGGVNVSKSGVRVSQSLKQ